MNAADEILQHVSGRPVKWVHIEYGRPYWEESKKAIIRGRLEDCLSRLNFEYDDGYGGQEIHGHIWYEDGTWSERGEYDGSEWWEHKVCPPIPEQ